MRLVIQRVSTATVLVGDLEVAQIGSGLLVLVGVGLKEQANEPEWLAGKVFHLRIFEDAEGKMNRSLAETAREVLVVPQFTLYGDVRKGRRPSWAAAAPPDEAAERVEEFCRALETLGARVSRGAFREHMLVQLGNDGPVTIILDGSA